MPGSVTRLRPRVGSLNQALAAFRSARLATCLSELHGLDCVAAATLRARARLRLGDPKRALDAVRKVFADDSRDRGELALLRAVACSRLGRAEESEAAFVDARVYGVSSTDAALQAEIDFYLGLTAFAEGSLAETRTACRRGLEVAHAAGRAATSNGGAMVPLAHVVARTHELLGLVEAAEGRYGEFLAHARSALATLDASDVPDVFQEAFAVKNLAILVRDFDLEEEARLVAGRAATLAWTDDVSRPRFVTAEALGWCSALQGDPLRALRWFREAAEAASTVPERVLSSVDKALLTRELGYQLLATEELEHAMGLASSYDWEGTVDDYRLYLLPLAQAAAPISPLQARAVLDRYCGIRNAMDPTFAARIEARVRAEESYTHGIVLRAEGRIAASTERLRVAFETWESIGYQWRAGRAALELAELNAGEAFRLALRREIARRPESVFATRARLVA